MNQEIKNIILTLITNDSSCGETERQTLSDWLNGRHGMPAKRLVGRREVLEMLGVSAPTLRGFIRRGLIKEIRLSPRKARFMYDQVVSFAETGVKEVNGPEQGNMDF